MRLSAPPSATASAVYAQHFESLGTVLDNNVCSFETWLLKANDSCSTVLVGHHLQPPPGARAGGVSVGEPPPLMPCLDLLAWSPTAHMHGAGLFNHLRCVL